MAQSTTQLSGFGQAFTMLFGLALFSAPGIIATVRKDPDQKKIWIFGLLGIFTIYITWVKALIWALRPSGKSIEQYQAEKSERKQKVNSQKRVKGGTGALKSTVENGDEVIGNLFLQEHFGWGWIRLYKNGYIYISTRMSHPEKLIAISGNTDLAVAQKQHLQLSGAILTVVTDRDVYTIGESTYAKSDFFSPSTIKSLTRLVAAGNALIGK